MGLSWQQGPLGGKSVGRFLTPEPLPERLLFAEPLRRRMRVRFGSEWIADSEDVVLLHEPGRYLVAYFPLADVRPDVLVALERTTRHGELGETTWFTVTVGDREAARGAWRYTDLPGHAAELRDRVAFAWRAWSYTETRCSDLHPRRVQAVVLRRLTTGMVPSSSSLGGEPAARGVGAGRLPQALAGVVGPLIEVLVLVGLVYLSLALRRRLFPAPDAVATEASHDRPPGFTPENVSGREVR